MGKVAGQNDPLLLSAMNGSTERGTERANAIAALVVGILALVVGGVALYRTRDESSKKAAVARPTTTTTVTVPPGKPVKVPDLVSKNGFAAAASLKTMGLKAKAVTANNPTVPKNNVISQD